MTKTYKFEKGGINEFEEFEVFENEEWRYDMQYDNADVCEHAQFIKEEGRYRYYNYPFAIKAYNEGGHNSTLVCLECAASALEAIKRGEIKPIQP